MYNNHDDVLKLAKIVDGAQYVYFCEDFEILYVWHGGNTVNIYSLNMIQNVDCFTFQDVPEDWHGVHSSILYHINEITEEMNEELEEDE